jgi:hypothetical protein
MAVLALLEPLVHLDQEALAVRQERMERMEQMVALDLRGQMELMAVLALLEPLVHLELMAVPVLLEPLVLLVLLALLVLLDLPVQQTQAAQQIMFLNLQQLLL